MAPRISLMPHAVCWKADPHLIWTMVVTNAITFLSYLTICLTLFYLVSHTRRVIARDWAYFSVGFALFIVACGTTHLMEVVTTWIPWFWVDASANIITALLSAYIAVMLIRRARTVAFSINDYAARLANTETEKLQMQQSLLAARKLEDWSRMSTVVSHEINNPVEAIQNLLYLIQQSPGVTSEVRELAHIASTEAERVITISKSTLDFFRQSGDLEVMDFKSAAESVQVVLGSVFSKSNVTMEIDCDGEVTVQALPGEIRQVLLNLVRNACEASNRPGSKVRVSIAVQGEGVQVIVADQGSGIDAKLLPSLFQFGASTKGEHGNGMGLWSVKQILNKYGGEISVESTLGVGTRFTLWWPRKPRPANTPELSLAQPA